MRNEKVIPIFFACDNNYYKFTAVVIKSIMANASKDYKYKFYVLTLGIDEENQKKAALDLKPNFEIEFVNVQKYYESIQDKLPCRDYYNKTIYFRIFIADMFPNIDKAIYIDSDTVVLGDISEFYNIDLGDNLIGACTEQVMSQIDLYGTYVENNLGLNRYTYFNDGHILINCKKFREECVLEQFLNLLDVYECKVTQDEDYLNIICEGKVRLINNAWNVETFEGVKVITREEDIKMLHFIMWSKPWRCDSKHSDHFWKYAKESVFYNEIKAIRDSITPENLEKDKVGYNGLVELTKNEIAREDTFVACKKKLGIKSIDRLKVLKRIETYESEAKFDEEVEDDPVSRQIKPGEVDYTKKKIRSKIKTRFAYFIARRFLNKLNRKKIMIVKDIIGKENLSNLKTGAILTCNHFNALDSFAMQMAYEASCDRKKKFYRVIKEGNYTSFPGFYGFLMRNCYTLPLASNQAALKEFMKSTNEILQKGNLVLVYPEQTMWWNYKKPKPLKKGAFQFAVNNNVPVVPCFITMKDSDIMGTDGFKVQEYTIHILEPIYPDNTKSKNENVKMMMDKNYQLWKELYEKTYEKPLVYNSMR